MLKAVAARFDATVMAPFLDKGVTVRSLRWALEQLPKRRGAADPALARLDPMRFDELAGASAKLELVKGKVMYTAVAASDDEAAAVLSSGRDELRLGYLVVAQVTPEGELLDLEIVRVEELREVKGSASALAARK